jgi:hypothetical protein
VTTDAVVERAWDPVKGPVDAKTGAGRRAVPMAFVVRRELTAHEARTGRDGRDLVFGRTANAAGLDWKQISTWRATAVSARPGTAGHLVPGGEDTAGERLDAFLTPTQPTPTVAHSPQNDETPVNTGVLKYRYRDSNPGFRRERAAS